MKTNKCEPRVKNTASSRCKYDWGLFRRIIITPLNASYTGVDEANQPITFDEWIMRGIHAASKVKRFYPMPLFSDSVSTSEDKTTWSNGYGETFVIKEGNKGLTQSYNQDFCLSNRLHSFNDGIDRRSIIFDNRKRAWGTEYIGGFAGVRTNLFCSTADITQPSEISEPKIDYTFKVPEEFAEKSNEDTELNTIEIEGLEDIIMNVVVSGSNLVITFLSACDLVDITSELAAISGVSECWLKDGAAMTTPPTYNQGVFTVAKPTSACKLSIADPSILYKNGVAFKECETIFEVVVS